MIDTSQIRARMLVISSDDRVVGTVCRAAATELWVTKIKDGRGFDHLIPIDWIEEVADYVFLNKSRRFLATQCEDVSRYLGGRKAA